MLNSGKKNSNSCVGLSLIVFNMCTIWKMGVGTVGNVYTVSLPQIINLPEADNYHANREKQYKKKTV